MGGNILSLYAATFPEQISHFINIEGFGTRNMSPHQGPAKMREWIESSVRDFRIYKNLEEFAERLSAKNPRVPKERLHFVAKFISQKIKGGYRFSSDPKHKWPHPHLYRLENAIAFWKNIQARCLLVMGEKSEIFSIEDSQKEFERRLNYFPKNSERIIIQDCGHRIHLEKPEELANRLVSFISK